MAASSFVAKQYNGEEFVESCGAILFDFQHPSPKVCLVHYLKKDEWLLAKGRRNCNESRADAALREMREETGFRCRLYPVTMPTRAPSSAEAGNVPDKARTYPDLTEPFMLSTWEVGGKSQLKLIWWYIAEVEDHAPKEDGEEEFVPEFLDCDEALQRLSFQGDRNVLAQAVALVRGQQATQQQQS